MANILKTEKKVTVISMLCEGSSIRAIERMTGVHQDTAESFFSLMKRGVFGSWHSISQEHLQKYANEFEYRWNTRHVSDGQRLVTFIPMIAGKRLLYRQPAN